MKKSSDNFSRILRVLRGLSVFGLLVFLSVSAYAQSKLVVKFPAETTIETERIELGAIAQISGDAENSRRLKKISFGYAPNVGLTREINREQIILAINAAGFSESEITLSSPAKILVRRAAQEISQSQIREVVVDLVLKQFAENKVEARIVQLDFPANIQAPIGKIEIRTNISGVRNLFEKFSLPVEICVDGKTFRRLAVTLEIEAFAEVFVAARDLSAQAKIVESDVKLEKRRITRPLQNYLRDANNLRGLVLIKNVSSAAEIINDAFVAGVAVKSGDTVRIEAASGNLKLIVSGTARSSGKIGDRIAVTNSQSGAIIKAKIIDEGLVRIQF